MTNWNRLSDAQAPSTVMYNQRPHDRKGQAFEGISISMSAENTKRKTPCLLWTFLLILPLCFQACTPDLSEEKLALTDAPTIRTGNDGDPTDSNISYWPIPKGRAILAVPTPARLILSLNINHSVKEKSSHIN
jgi:hypothetical protein